MSDMPSPQPTLVDVDRALDDAVASLANFGAALFELDSERERRSPAALRFTGYSALSWDQAVSRLSILWSWRQAVSQRLEAARLTRGTGRPRPAQIASLWRMLQDPVVELEDPLAKGGHPSRVSIASALNDMSETFDFVSESIASLFAIELFAFPEISKIEYRAAVLAGSDGLTDDLRSALSTLLERLTDLRRRVAEDPLTVDGEQIVSIESELEDLDQTISASADARAELTASLAALRSEVDQLEAELDPARSVVESAEAKILGCGALKAALADRVRQISTLRGDIGRLSNAQGEPTAVVAATRALQDQVSAVRTAVGELVDASSQALEHRRDLRGRLGAYQAKVRALGLAENPDLEELHRAALDALYSAPCDLDEGERLVSIYADGIERTRIGAIRIEDRLR
jgi:predicted  nucleic acid-binding Zn-ribbon protein